MSNPGNASTSTDNLPTQLSSFVGRAAELEQVRGALLAGRLVTISGAGGSGKTRLAIEVARRMGTSFADGVWLVGLAPISDPALVVQALAVAVGASEVPGRAPIETLVTSLSQSELLLVMDNCEHVIDACAELADAVLRACPKVRVLATSRERLRIDGETVFALASLSVPDAVGDKDLSKVAESEAVELFLDRARSVQPGFELTPVRAPLIASICRHLEGMPLGIELAAARVGTLSLQEIDRRLGESLGVLIGGSRTAPKRQQTLTAAIEWSYNLLNGAEQMLFRRLAVFHGGWTLDAAEGVWAEARVTTDEVADVLTGLVEKSLVLVVEQPGGEVRYRLLEPLRQFGHEKMAEAGDVDDTLDRHAKWFGALAERMEEGIFRPEQIGIFDVIDVEMNNFRAAMAWSIRRPERLESGMSIARTLAPYWIMRANTTEGVSWLEQVFAAAAAGRHPRAYTILIRAGLAVESPRALGALETAVEGARGAEDQQSLCTALTLIALQYWLHERPEDARSAAEEAVRLARMWGSDLAMARSLGALAVALSGSDGPRDAILLFEESLTFARASGDRNILTGNLNNLADLERSHGFYESAQAHYDEARGLLIELRASARLVVNSLNLGLLAIKMGDLARSVPLLRESLEGAVAGGRSVVTACALLGLAASADPLTSATLLGSGQALLVSTGAKIDPNDRSTWEQIEGASRQRLTSAEFEAAYAAGQAMPVEEAVAIAQSVAKTNDGAEPMIRRAPVTAETTELVEQLTGRELETLRLLASGLTNKEIAVELVVSVRTVENHVANLYGKIGARGRADATAFALSHGLMDGPA